MLSFDTLLYNIRRQETPLMRTIRDLLQKILYCEIPGILFLIKPVYSLWFILHTVCRLLLEKLISLPIFRARCCECGKHISLPHGIPWIEGQLKIRVGDYVQLDDPVFLSGHLMENPELVIGNRTVIGYKAIFSVQKSIRIGDDCMIGGGCMIFDNDGHPMSPYRRLRRESVRPEEVKPVVIEDNVWVGAGAAILKGVRIGEGSVIGTRSVVLKSVPPYSMVMGVPAKIVITGINRIYKKDAGTANEN